MENKNIWFCLIPGLITGTLIALFLSGKIIDYPHGTPKGGMIAGIGVLVIMISVAGISILIIRFLKYRKKRDRELFSEKKI